jgi:hypothetical protein
MALPSPTDHHFYCDLHTIYNICLTQFVIGIDGGDLCRVGGEMKWLNWTHASRIYSSCLCTSSSVPSHIPCSCCDIFLNLFVLAWSWSFLWTFSFWFCFQNHLWDYIYLFVLKTCPYHLILLFIYLFIYWTSKVFIFKFCL